MEEHCFPSWHVAGGRRLEGMQLWLAWVLPAGWREQEEVLTGRYASLGGESSVQHSVHSHSPSALPSVCACACACACARARVYKEPDVPEGNISAQGCQKAGWYMVLKNAHVFVCARACVHGMSVCGTESKRTHMQPGLLEHTGDELFVGGGAMNLGQCSKPQMFICATELRKEDA